jgi:menaquinone-dependent protoporphyrinogen oxidase
MTSSCGTQWWSRRSTAPAAAELDLSVMLRRPAQELFALLAEIQDAEPLPRRTAVRMEKDPSGPTAVGTRWHEAVRIVPGCWLRIESIVTEMEPPVRLGMDFTTRWFAGHLTYEIETTQDGCILHHRETLRPHDLGYPPSARRRGGLRQAQRGYASGCWRSTLAAEAAHRPNDSATFARSWSQVRNRQDQRDWRDQMLILVAYASKHGGTQGIAERIGEVLRAAGQPTDIRPVTEVEDASGYDAFVIGSATYAMHWVKDAAAFIRRNSEVLRRCPVWLFSSGPLGTQTITPEGQDVRDSAEPKEMAEFVDAIHPEQHRVFYGVLDPSKLGFGERMIRKLPAGRDLLPEGDFRDWSEIEEWAKAIASEVADIGRHGEQQQ